MKSKNNIIAVFVACVIFLIIVPLNPAFLDLMLILNITISLSIFLISMYIKEALEFSVFPTILLVTTLFRVALNISSTRLILGKGGEAGAVIKTFGEFVIGGNVVVGIIIFIILVIVQFIVITKGAERVAEVAARFTLDAMPGKQMAIDADLNSGLINEETAKMRRLKIQREADFYGAMDGGSKFVKGDAIVSIIIVFINIIAGTIIGMVQGGQTLGKVIQKYTIATVGDGLVSSSRTSCLNGDRHDCNKGSVGKQLERRPYRSVHDKSEGVHDCGVCAAVSRLDSAFQSCRLSSFRLS